MTSELGFKNVMPYYLVSLGKSLGCEEALVNPESS